MIDPRMRLFGICLAISVHVYIANIRHNFYPCTPTKSTFIIRKISNVHSHFLKLGKIIIYDRLRKY